MKKYNLIFLANILLVLVCGWNLYKNIQYEERFKYEGEVQAKNTDYWYKVLRKRVEDLEHLNRFLEMDGKDIRPRVAVLEEAIGDVGTMAMFCWDNDVVRTRRPLKELRGNMRHFYLECLEKGVSEDEIREVILRAMGEK